MPQNTKFQSTNIMTGNSVKKVKTDVQYWLQTSESINRAPVAPCNINFTDTTVDKGKLALVFKNVMQMPQPFASDSEGRRLILD